MKLEAYVSPEQNTFPNRSKISTQTLMNRNSQRREGYTLQPRGTGKAFLIGLCNTGARNNYLKKGLHAAKESVS